MSSSQIFTTLCITLELLLNGLPVF